MVRVWILFLVCTYLGHQYETSRIRRWNNGVITFSDSSKSKFVFSLLCVIMVCFAGLRTRMNDTFAYIHSYNIEGNVPVGWNQIFKVNWSLGANPLFNVYRRVIRNIFGPNSQRFVFVTSLIVECSYLKFLKRYSLHFGWSIFTLFGFTAYAFTMAAMKQSLSVAIGIWAIPCFLEKKYGKAIIFLIVACLFHPYVLILGMLYFLRNDVWEQKTMLIVFGTIIAALFFSYFTSFLLAFSDSFGDDYTIESFTENGVGMARIVSALAVPLVTYMCRKEINALNNKFVNMCVNATIISGCIAFISGFGGAYSLGRVPDYFSLLTCITVPIVFSTCNYRNRGLYKTAFICLVIVFYYTYYEKYRIAYCGGDWFGDIYQHASISSLLGR